jgi:hypothetical protein
VKLIISEARGINNSRLLRKDQYTRSEILRIIRNGDNTERYWSHNALAGLVLPALFKRMAKMSAAKDIRRNIPRKYNFTALMPIYEVQFYVFVVL